MLGQPVAVIAEPVGRLGEVERLPDGVGGRSAVADGRLVEGAETQHCAHAISAASG
jgi:hypothetical protein